MQAADEITVQILPDGMSDTRSLVSAGFIQQPDGSWLLSSTTSDTTVLECRLPIGRYTLRVLDSSGHVLAEGSFPRQ